MKTDRDLYRMTKAALQGEIQCVRRNEFIQDRAARAIRESRKVITALRKMLRKMK